jgi:SAM-dependent methyltransferase
MGFFTLEAARRVGPRGRVVAVDLQPRMLAALRKRATRAGLADRIEAREARPESLGVDHLVGKVDLVLALLVVHEFPDAGRLFEEVRRTLAPGGTVLVAAPSGHVGAEAFEASMAAAARAGAPALGRPEGVAQPDGGARPRVTRTIGSGSALAKAATKTSLTLSTAAMFPPWLPAADNSAAKSLAGPAPISTRWPPARA